jgi:hypothetical protein
MRGRVGRSDMAAGSCQQSTDTGGILQGAILQGVILLGAILLGAILQE